MKGNRTLISLLFLLAILFAYQLFKIHATLRKEYSEIGIAEEYQKSLNDYQPGTLNHFATNNFLRDLEIQSQKSPVFDRYLFFFKTDTDNYPVNVLNFLFRHMAIHPSPPNAIILKDSTLIFELQVGGSSPTNIQFCFESREHAIRLDSISNLHLFFERLDCKRNELLSASNSVKNDR